MYENDYYHGDLKPDNLIIVKKAKSKQNTEYLEIKIIDFAGAIKKP